MRVSECKGEGAFPNQCGQSVGETGLMNRLCISVERNSDGSLKDEVECVACAGGFRPSPDGSACVPCRDQPVLAPATPGEGGSGGARSAASDSTFDSTANLKCS